MVRMLRLREVYVRTTGVPLDVVHRGAGLLRLALGHVRDRRSGELCSYCIGHLRPRRAECRGAGADLALQQLDDLQNGDLLRRTRERVAALDPSLRLQYAAAAQGHEQRLEELRRDVAAGGYLADRNRYPTPARELRERAHGVRRFCSYDQQPAGDFTFLS